MALFKKKEKPAPEPQYYTSVNNEQVLNYKVYHMKNIEKIMYSIVLFVLSGLVGLVFYANLFMLDGKATIFTHISNIVVFIIFGFIGIKIFIPIVENTLKEKRQKQLRIQFRDMLAALSASFSAGENATGAFQSAYKELTAQYGEDSYISHELKEIVTSFINNFSVDDVLTDFGERSGIEDIVDFANVYSICKRQGGDLKKVVRETYDLIGEKISINEEIKTKLTSNKTQQNVMSVVPIFIIAFLRFSSSSFAENFASPTGVITMTVAIGIFVGSYLYGRKIVNIEG